MLPNYGRLFNIFGEFKDKKLENEYLDTHWQMHKKLYFLSYLLCSVLLLFAGIFIDFQRTFVWGSAEPLTALRVILVFISILLFPLYWKSTNHPKSYNYYGLLIMMLSSVIILLLNHMTGGLSKTMLPGALIISTSYYVVVPNRVLFSFFAAFLQIISIALFYNADILGKAGHIYMVFMLVAINTVLIFFKVMQNKSNRTTHLMIENHKKSAVIKDRILNIIGHDLKNPLTIIKLKTTVSKKMLERGDTLRVKKELEGIDNASTSLYDLLQSLLKWAISEKENKDLYRHSIKPCFEKTLIFCKDIALQKDLQIHSEIQDHYFKFSPDMIETIVRNLLTNAIKFTPNNKNITLTGQVTESHYYIKIKDEGIGMTQDLVQKITKGINTSSQEGTNNEAGSGLGLNLVYEFIRVHNATFKINSEPGVGSEFIIGFKLE